MLDQGKDKLTKEQNKNKKSKKLKKIVMVGGKIIRQDKKTGTPPEPPMPQSHWRRKSEEQKGRRKRSL